MGMGWGERKGDGGHKVTLKGEEVWEITCSLRAGEKEKDVCSLNKIWNMFGTLVVFVVNCVWRPPTTCAWACVCLWTRAKNLLRHIKDKSFRIGLGICNHERPQTLLTERRGIGKKSETLVCVSELADKQLSQTSVSYTAEMPGPNTVLITGSNDLNCARVQYKGMYAVYSFVQLENIHHDTFKYYSIRQLHCLWTTYGSAFGNIYINFCNT